MSTAADTADIDAISIIAGDLDRSLPRATLAELAAGTNASPMQVAIFWEPRSGAPYHVAATAIEAARVAVSARPGLKVVFAVPEGPLVEVWTMALADRKGELVRERTPPPEPAAEPPRSPMQILVDTAFEKLSQTRADGDPRWSEKNLTPPFPEVWPPDGTGRLVYYAWAYAFEYRLVDGVLLSAPFAAIFIDPRGDSAPEVVALSDRIQSWGVLGVRPLMPSDAMPALDPERGAERERALWDPHAAEQDREAIRRWYSARWWVDNVRLAKWVAARHPEFHAWLTTL